jgi:hypothetical protein
MNDPNLIDDEEERDDAIVGTALKWSLVVFAVVGVMAGAAAWMITRPKPAPPPVVRTVTLPSVREKPKGTIPRIPFTDITQSAGITFRHENGAAGEKLLPETMGGGCALLDFDQDRDQDILLVNSMRWPWDERPPAADLPTMKLYRNDGTGRFTDVTVETGLAVTFYGMGVACGDYDNDGDIDLFFTCVGPNHLFRNDGGKFVEVTEAAGLAGTPDQWSTAAGWFDFDNDRDLDLFVCNYLKWSREFDLAQEFQLTGGTRAYGRPQEFEGAFPYLYRNDGEGKFTDVSASAGIQVKNAATGVPLPKALGLTFADFDQDGWLDVVVANDTVQNLLFHNRRNGQFSEIGALAGVAFDNNGNARGAMGIDVAHFRNNDDLGIAIGNFANEMTALYVSRNHELQFTDEAVSNGLGPTSRLELKFGVSFADFDLDGRLDFLAANGHLEDEINKVQPSQHYEQPPHLYWNCGPEHESEFLMLQAEQCGTDFLKPLVGRGVSIGDIDDDGDLDVLITSSGQQPRLLRNDQKLGHHWMRVKLVASQCNRDAIGSWVDVYVGNQVLRRQVMPTRSYLSQTELPVTFGLGKADKVDRIVIRWADGSLQEIKDVQVDQSLTVEQQVLGYVPPSARWPKTPDDQ